MKGITKNDKLNKNIKRFALKGIITILAQCRS